VVLYLHQQRRERIAQKSHKKRAFVLTLFLSFLSVHIPLSADNQKITILKVSSSPKIDGEIESSFWGQITPLKGFTQYDPYNGEPASEDTHVYLAYDENNLYIAFNCLDSEPDKIKGDLTPREGYWPNGNDCVDVILDTFFDKRNRYDFFVNPKGVQRDTPGDYVWDSAASINEDGWSAEIKIPFKSIRFPTEGDKPWNVNFKRYVFRLKETSLFTHVGRDDVTLEKSAELHGLRGIKGGKNLEFFPYIGYRDSKSGDEKDSKFAVGIDAKYSITSNLNLDVTVSPDFSEVESDPFFYQLSPYEFYLQEKRPFFQEAYQYLGFDLFYTRRITNPKFAFKLTGKEKGYTIGLLGALNNPEDETQYLGVCRVKKDIFKLSSISLTYSGYDTPDFTNHNGGIELDLTLSQKTSIALESNFAFNSDLEKKNNASYYARYSYFPDEGLSFRTAFTRIEKNYRPRAGYQPRRDWQYLDIMPGYSKRINKHGIKKITFYSGIYFYQDASGKNLGYEIMPFMFFVDSMKQHWFRLVNSFGKLKAQVYGEDGLIWTDNFIKKIDWAIMTGYDGNRFFSYAVYTWIGREPVYNDDFTEAYDGKYLYFGGELALKPTSFLNFGINFEYSKQNRVDTGEEVFEGLISAGTFHYQISKYLFVSSYIQHDSYYKRINLDLLFGIELGMGNQLLLSYKTFSPLEGSPYEDSARSFVIKASYLLRL
jgi:hypothetical protein